MNWPLSDHTLTSLSLWTICLWCNSAPALPFPPAASPLRRVTSVWVSSHSLAFIYQRIQTDNIHHIVTYCSIDSLYLYCTVRRKYIQYWWISVTFVPGCFWCCHYETKNITMQVKQSAAYMCVCVWVSVDAWATRFMKEAGLESNTVGRYTVGLYRCFLHKFLSV